MPLPKTSPTKPYDWTYTSVYPGHFTTQDQFSFTAADPGNVRHVIPIAELSRQDPILFYAEIPLYEDELHDNGMSQITIRVVSPKPHCLLFYFAMFNIQSLRGSCRPLSSYSRDLLFEWIMFYSERTILASITPLPPLRPL